MSEHVSVRQLRQTTQKTQEWLKELASKGPFESEDQAYTYLRAVLHALRDRLTVEEAAHFAQQLPMLVRGFYYEGWRPALAPARVESRVEFIDRVEASLGGVPPQGETIDTGAATGEVLGFLEGKLQEGTLRHVKQQLPPELRALFPGGEPAAVE